MTNEEKFGAAASGEGANKSKMVLVVDDEPTNVMIISGVLASQGYVVVAAENGLSGVEAYLGHKPDIVISDFDMPGMNGAEMISAIRACSTSDNLLIVALSNQSNPDRAKSVERECLAAGADYYQGKKDLMGVMELVVQKLPKLLAAKSAKPSGPTGTTPAP